MSEPGETLSPAAPPPRIDAILLAAGSSRRFGSANKLLAEIDGIPLVRRTAITLETVFAGRLVVVLGHDTSAIRRALAGLACRFVDNPHHRDGIATSIAAGITAISPAAEAVLIAQADMPGLDAALLARLLDRVRATGAGAIVHPVGPNGRQATPVIWPRDLLPELATLTGDQGAKQLLARHRDRVATLTAPAEALVDVDTPEALDAWRRANPGVPPPCRA